MSAPSSPPTALATALDQAKRGTPEPVTGPFVVYGAGGFGKALGTLVEQAGGRVTTFIDAAPKSGFPWPVVSRGDAGRISKDAIAVIGIFNPAVDIAPLATWLLDLGFRDVWSPVQAWHRLSRAKPPDAYWLTSLPGYLAHREEIVAGAEVFADERSANVYVDLWRYRLTGDPALARIPGASTLEEQYFPADLPAWRTPLRLVDAGAYTGDTLVAARQRGLAVEAVAAFEPDPANFARLAATLSSLPGTDAFAVPCGVLGSTRQVRFSAGAGAGSAISADGSVTIQCVSLDEALHGFRPTLVKMDIEGAEAEALEGARRTITASRPGLAVCVYHAPDHIWSIPAMLREWDLGYRFHLRAHAFQGFDTVLYAIPG